MKSGLQAYRIAENWTFRSYDRMLFQGLNRSLLAWLAILLTAATVYGGAVTLLDAWPTLSQSARNYFVFGLCWVLLPCARLVRESMRVRKALPKDGDLSDRELGLHREAATSMLISVMSACGAFNAMLVVARICLLKH